MKKREREEGNAPYHQHNNAMSRPERGQKRQREEDEAGPSLPPKEDVNDEASKPKKET